MKPHYRDLEHQVVLFPNNEDHSGTNCYLKATLSQPAEPAPEY